MHRSLSVFALVLAIGRRRRRHGRVGRRAGDTHRQTATNRPHLHTRSDDGRVSRRRRRDRRRAQSGAVGPHGRDGADHPHERRADGARHRARQARRQEPADPRQGRDDEHHVQGGAKRHVFLLGAGTSARRHGRAARSYGRTADPIRRRVAGRQRRSAEPRFRNRDAGRDGGQRAARSSSRKTTARGPDIRAVTGSAAARRAARARARSRRRRSGSPIRTRASSSPAARSRARVSSSCWPTATR